MLARGHQSAVVVNADGPTLPTARLVRAAVALEAEGDRVVLGPADDGGYYLLGVKAAHAHLFADIGWSTDSVATTTRVRAAELGLEVVELPSWYDVDDPESLNRLAAETSDPAVMAGAASTVHKVSSANHLAGWPPGPRRTQAPPGNGAFGPAREPAVTELDLVPYAAPFTARALARWDAKAGSARSRGMIRLWLLGGVLFALTMGGLSLHVPGALGIGSISLKTWFVVIAGVSAAVYLLAVLLVTHRTGSRPRRVGRAAGRGGAAPAADRVAAVPVHRHLSLRLGRARPGRRRQPLPLPAGRSSAEVVAR